MLRILLTVGFFFFYLILPSILKKGIDWKRNSSNLLEGSLAGFLAGLLAAIVGSLITEYFSLWIILKVQVILLAPLVEETLKFWAIRFLQKKGPAIQVEHGYGVGLGFGMEETLLKISLGVTLFPEIFPLRTIFTMSMHIFAASVSAFGIRKSIETNRKRYYLFIGLAIAIHAAFNIIALHVESEFQR